jgi:uncharacterized membrane protein
MDAITETIDRQQWLEPVADNLQQAVKTTFEAGGQSGEEIKQFLHGKWLGHPLHPVLTDVPLGAWTVAAVLDAVEATTGREEMAPGADAAVAIGLAGAVGSAVTGLTDWHETQGEVRQVGLVHGLLNVGATALYTASWIMRRRGARTTGRNLAWLGFAIASASAYLGGELVYTHGIGVEKTPVPEHSPST